MATTPPSELKKKRVKKTKTKKTDLSERSDINLEAYYAQAAGTKDLFHIGGVIWGTYPTFLPQRAPGKWLDDMTKESYEYMIFQSHLFTGLKFDQDISPCENLKIMTEVKAGAPGKDATFVPSAICFGRTFFLHSRWDGNLSTIIARAKWRPNYAIGAQVSTRVGSDYNKNFVLDAQLDINAQNYTVELQYEGAQDNMISLSYNQMLTNYFSVSSTLMYSLAQQSSILSYVSRWENYNMALFGTVMLQQIPNMNLFIPNRLTQGFSIVNESSTSATRYVTEFQVNPSETNAFDTVVQGYYELRRRGTVTKASFDSNYRLSIYYEEQEPTGKFGQISYSAVADYLKKEFNFGLGFTIQQ